jgi:hypothetical protein
MQRNSTTSRKKQTSTASRDRRAFAISKIDKVYRKTATVQRFGFVLTRARARQLFGGLIKKEAMREVDEIELLFFIKEPQKKGGKQ